jgi:ankyrin repeat protein
VRPAVCRAIAQDGDTPLHFCAQYGNVECVHVLLQRGAHPGAMNKARRRAPAADTSLHHCLLRTATV